MEGNFLLLLVILSFHVYLTTSSDPDPIQDFCIPKPISSHHHRHFSTSPPCKNSSEVTTEDFIFSGLKSAGKFSQTGFATIPVSPLNFPGLNTLGMSFVRADFKVGAINPPHFHPRATEISHVVKGRVYSGFVDSDNRVYARVVEEGEIMVFPKGLVHFQMNVGDFPATVFASLNSQSPGVQKIPAAVFGSGIDEELLVKAFGLSPKQIGTMKKRFEPEKGK
ncbi:PREDICTED: germin-like protein subfamily 3 member 2 [Tarenaya hassleriana]|uniref:germin-like protein subfamily 3 member 2 n=1 Tax=Tarenaya hassleriana TaxID=28532 RepID=UPI00053C4615|nr:PREDICTED: germin-like protein subfamily 3 member 2 [Tarenaya hassleriana]